MKERPHRFVLSGSERLQSRLGQKWLTDTVTVGEGKPWRHLNKVETWVVTRL